jgi:hypothetical protein
MCRGIDVLIATLVEQELAPLSGTWPEAGTDSTVSHLPPGRTWPHDKRALCNSACKVYAHMPVQLLMRSADLTWL